jgi:putative nucleotidyltransferase with HDIG domain
VAEKKYNKKKNISNRLNEDLDKVERQILANPLIEQVAAIARQQELSLYLVGGAIRDTLLDKKIRDYDFILKKVKIPPFLHQLQELWGASLFPMGKGKRERIYRLKKDELTVDFAAMKGADIVDDLMQRDFTINAIAYAFGEGKFYAAPRAIGDIKAGRIALVSAQALQADPLRMLRAVRYRCTLPGFDLITPLEKEVAHRRKLLSSVAPERIRAELDEIILSPLPAQGLLLMQELGLLAVVFPELTPLEGLPQGRHHRMDALSHTIEVVREVDSLARKGNPFSFRPREEERLILGYAALFHDLGKPTTQSIDEKGDLHFYGHPQESSRLARGIMRRLKFASVVREGVFHLVENHMRILTLAAGEPLDRALRRLIHAIGEKIRLLLLLGLAETGPKGSGNSEEQERFLGLCRRIWDLYEKEDLISPEPLLWGRDLLAMGHPPGPRLGEILNEVRQRQITGELKTKVEALRFVEERYPPSIAGETKRRDV